ncbi:MAG: hypothetical protein NT175_14115 [Bacteroidetes bacterium]|nr:hypothetical protein [Bacteroidota bacterium]
MEIKKRIDGLSDIEVDYLNEKNNPDDRVPANNNYCRLPTDD